MYIPLKKNHNIVGIKHFKLKQMTAFKRKWRSKACKTGLQTSSSSKFEHKECPRPLTRTGTQHEKINLLNSII